jgi:hypothetical protein
MDLLGRIASHLAGSLCVRASSIQLLSQMTAPRR